MRFARLYALGLTGFQGFSPGVDDWMPPRTRAEVDEARRQRDGILKGLAFIQTYARDPKTAENWIARNFAEILRLEEICRSDSP